MVSGRIRNLLRVPLLLAALATGGALHAHEAEPGGRGRPDMAQRWAASIQRAAGSAIALAADEAGDLWLARMRGGQIWVARSSDGGRSFAEPVAVNPEPEAILADGQSRPRIAVRDGVIAVLWAQALPKVFSGHVRFARSTDGGRSFSAPRTINDNREEIGHGFGALALAPGGRLAIAWLDARDRVAAARAGRKARGSSLYYSLSDDGGKTFAPNRRLAESTCECCRIGLAMMGDATPVALWRHIFGSGERDFAVARLAPQAPVLRASEERWAIQACPHHGGDLAVDGEDGVHLAWFSGSPEAPGLHYRRVDGGRPGAPRPFGDPDAQAGHPAVHAAGPVIHLAWRELDGDGYRLLSMRSDDRGTTWSAPRVVARTGGASDLPLFVTGAAHPLLAWASEAEGVRVLDLRDGAP